MVMKNTIFLFIFSVALISSTPVQARGGRQHRQATAAATPLTPAQLPLPVWKRIFQGYGLITTVYALGAYLFFANHALLMAGVISKCLSTHFSKKLASFESASILLDSIALGCASLLLKEGLSASSPPMMETLPDWMKRRRVIEQHKLINETNFTVQATRIDAFKETALTLHFKLFLKELKPLTEVCRTRFYCEDKSSEIAILLSSLVESVLEIYPGYTDDTNRSFIASPNLQPLKTGELFPYSDQLVLDFFQKQHLRSRIPEKSIQYIEDELKTLFDTHQRGKAKYFQHFLSLLGIPVKLPEPAAQADAGTQAGNP